MKTKAEHSIIADAIHEWAYGLSSVYKESEP